MNTPPEQDRPTILLQRARAGDAQANDQLFNQLYDELKALARRQPYADQYGHTLQPTVLVNELWIQLARRFPEFQDCDDLDREVFYNTVATVMRRLLNDAYRRKSAKKRGGDHQIIAMGEHDPGDHGSSMIGLDFIAIDEALTALEAYNRRWYDVVKYRFLLGRTIAETADLLSIGTATVNDDWRKAQAWLRGRLRADDRPSAS